MDFDSDMDYFSDEIEALIALCAFRINEGQDYLSFIQSLKNDFDNQTWPAEINWPFLFNFAQMFWQHYPHISQNYALVSAPKLQRNDACVCGSNKKYKHCCLAITDLTPTMVEKPDFTYVLLELLPKTRWKELANSRIAINGVVQAAYFFIGSERYKDARQLLEPWFKSPQDFVAKREALLDLLIEVYFQGGNSRKKKQLLDKAIMHGDNVIKSTAMQRMASMLCDENKVQQAYALFTEAQKLTPDSPSLAHLEISILVVAGDYERAKQRALFWEHRLKRYQDASLDGIIEFLREVKDNPKQAFQTMAIISAPELKQLKDALACLPPIELLYIVEKYEDFSASLLPANGAHRALIGNWYELVNGSEFVAGSPEPVKQWLLFLQKHPQAWNSFEVIDCFISYLGANYDLDITEELEEALLLRAEKILLLTIKQNKAEAYHLPWPIIENRAPLSLMGQLITFEGEYSDTPQQTQRLELMLRLNPNDNQGFRELLQRHYLFIGQPSKAVALCEQFPDDLPMMEYNYVLALFANNQKGKALAHLSNLVKDSNNILKALLSTKAPKTISDSADYYSVGSAEEAQIYRETAYPLWKALGAIDWLKQANEALVKT